MRQVQPTSRWSNVIFGDMIQVSNAFSHLTKAPDCPLIDPNHGTGIRCFKRPLRHVHTRYRKRFSKNETHTGVTRVYLAFLWLTTKNSARSKPRPLASTSRHPFVGRHIRYRYQVWGCLTCLTPGACPQLRSMIRQDDRTESETGGWWVRRIGIRIN